jgi:hypothetical protein
VTVGSEPSLDDYTNIDVADAKIGALMKKNGDAKDRLGYCSFTALGYSEAKPPEDFHAAAAEVNQRFIESWAKALAGGGVPKSRLYTHVAANAAGAGLDFMNAPVSIAFIASARPGWTTYPLGNLKDGFEPLTSALAEHKSPHWASTEAAPFNEKGPTQPYDYLRRHFDNGAVLVVMNSGATGDLGGVLGAAVNGPRAIAAYQRFLSLR